MTAEEATRIAIKIAGGAVAVAREFGISGQAVSQWSTVPANRAKRLAELSNGTVRVEHLRPDIFGPTSAVSAPSASTAAQNTEFKQKAA